MTKENIVDSIVKDWSTPILRPDVYEAMRVHAIEFAKWLNKECQAWGDNWVYANGDGKDYDTADIYKIYDEQQNKDNGSR